jgi:tetratricopeptide (TPR) repeat protein
MRSNYLYFGIGAIGASALAFKFYTESGVGAPAVGAAAAAVFFSGLVVATALTHAGVLKRVRFEHEQVLPPLVRPLIRPLGCIASFGIACYAALVGASFDADKTSLADVRALNDKGQHSDALTTCMRYIKHHPGDAAGWAERSYTENYLYKYNDALESGRKCVELDAKNVLGLSNYAWALNSIGHYGAALSFANRAVRVAPDDPESWCAQGDAYFGLGDYQRALTAFNRHAQLHPDEEYGFSRRADTYEKLGLKQLAEADRKKAASLAN